MSSNAAARDKSYSNRINTSKERGMKESGSHSVTPYKNRSMPINLSINHSKTPKEYGKKHIGSIRSDERLNLSVEIV